MDYPLLIFTDLDGTLLDHDSYSFAGAARTLERLRELDIPLILTTSKTRAEIRKLQQQLGMSEAFISENGGGIFLPQKYSPIIDPHQYELKQYGELRALLFGLPYASIREIFQKLSDSYHLKGFSDMAVEEIMERTGLGREDALLATRRDFTEPFVFLDQPCAEELQKEVNSLGLKITRGGRFYHLMGADQDKGKAVMETTEMFRAAAGKKLFTVGLGDARNDYEMLASVDIPVLLPKPDGTYEKMNIAGLRRAPHPGSRGWGIIVADILEEVAKD